MLRGVSFFVAKREVQTAALLSGFPGKEVCHKDVIRLLHMVVVAWAGFGNQATTWGDKQ